jgi:hypothetical protein
VQLVLLLPLPFPLPLFCPRIGTMAQQITATAKPFRTSFDNRRRSMWLSPTPRLIVSTAHSGSMSEHTPGSRNLRVVSLTGMAPACGHSPDGPNPTLTSFAPCTHERRYPVITAPEYEALLGFSGIPTTRKAMMPDLLEDYKIF